MPRTNKRKTTTASCSSTDIAAAVKEVVDEGLKVRQEGLKVRQDARDSDNDRMTLMQEIQ